MDELKEFKLCSCGHKNPITLDDCEKCQLELPLVQISSRKNEKKEKKKSKIEEKKEELFENSHEEDSAFEEILGNKFKFCSCGKKNKKMARFCVLCKSDLSFEVAMTENDYQKMKKTTKSHVEPIEIVGKSELYLSHKGGEGKSGKYIPSRLDISAWIYSQEAIDYRDMKTFSCNLFSLEGNSTVSVDKFPVLLGRGDGPLQEYLVSKKYVSRSHIFLHLEDDGIYLEPLSETNPTFVNQKSVREKVRLKSGDEIGLGGNRLEKVPGHPGLLEENVAYFKFELLGK